MHLVGTGLREEDLAGRHELLAGALRRAWLTAAKLLQRRDHSWLTCLLRAAYALVSSARLAIPNEVISTTECSDRCPQSSWLT